MTQTDPLKTDQSSWSRRSLETYARYLLQLDGGGSIESQLTNSPPHAFMYPMLVARLLNRPVATR